MQGGGPEWLAPALAPQPEAEGINRQPNRGVDGDNEVDDTDDDEGEDDGGEDDEDEDGQEGDNRAVEGGDDEVDENNEEEENEDGDENGEDGDESDNEENVEQAEVPDDGRNWNPIDWDRAADELTWERMLGLDGSLAFLEHVFWVISLNTIFVLVFAFIPFNIGHVVVKGFTPLKELFEMSHFDGLLSTLAGYTVLATMLSTAHVC
jgi:E3 ubiquitin-protein ligase MARCH6